MASVGPWGTHDCVPLGPETSTGHVVVTQPLPIFAALGVQDDTAWLRLLFVAQVVVTQLFATVPAEAEQVCTATLVVMIGLQLMVVQLFPAAAPWTLQVGDGTLNVLALLQVVVTQAGEVGPEAVQVCTATLDRLLGVQVVNVQLLPAVAGEGVQVCT